MVKEKKTKALLCLDLIRYIPCYSPWCHGPSLKSAAVLEQDLATLQSVIALWKTSSLSVLYHEVSILSFPCSWSALIFNWSKIIKPYLYRVLLLHYYYTCLLSFKFFVFMCISILLACMYVHHVHSTGRDLLDFLELELGVAVSRHVCTGNWTWFLCESSKCS